MESVTVAVRARVCAITTGEGSRCVAVGYEVIPGEHRVAAIWVGPQR